MITLLLNNVSYFLLSLPTINVAFETLAFLGGLSYHDMKCHGSTSIFFETIKRLKGCVLEGR